MKEILVDDSIFVGGGFLPDTNQKCLVFIQDEHGEPGRYSDKYIIGSEVSQDKTLLKLIIPNIESWYIITSQLMVLGNDFLQLPTKVFRHVSECSESEKDE